MHERPKPYEINMVILKSQVAHNAQAEQDFLGGVEEEEKDRDFNISLPYSDLAGIWFNEGDNLSNASFALPLWRLNQVNQLGFLINLGADEDFDNSFAEPFHHTRVNHSLVVGMVMGRILRRNKASEQDVLIGEAAGVIHDIATPAGGDAVKLVDEANLDEEEFWWEVIEDKGWEYLQGIGATREKIDDIVHNRGFLGRVLDISDKITYVMHDLAAFMGNGVWTNNVAVFRGYNKEFEKLLYQDTSIGDIYKTVNIDEETGQIYFSDPEKLRKFLEIRAVLHRDIYLNWASQGRDMLIRELLRPLYSAEPKDGKLTPHDLRKMGDEQLLTFVAEKYGDDKWEKDYFSFRLALDKFKPLVEVFSTIEEAEERKQELEQNPELIVLGTKQVRSFKTGTDYLVLDDNGNVIPFYQHDPICSKRLENIAAATEKNFVFYANTSDIPRPLKAA